LTECLFKPYNLNEVLKGNKEYSGVMAQIGLLEDNARIAKLCATMLQYAGHQVIIYEHPRECLKALLPQVASASLPVDVLILDLHLPDIDGIEVLQRLCSYPHTQSLPLIFCTAATPAEIARALSVAPHACFIEKPFTFQDLTSTVKNALALPTK
jgi:CheY-like chemotaxis protein